MSHFIQSNLLYRSHVSCDQTEPLVTWFHPIIKYFQTMFYTLVWQLPAHTHMRTHKLPQTDKKSNLNVSQKHSTAEHVSGSTPRPAPVVITLDRIITEYSQRERVNKSCRDNGSHNITYNYFTILINPFGSPTYFLFIFSLPKLTSSLPPSPSTSSPSAR